jgi:hypothetical protein
MSRWQRTIPALFASVFFSLSLCTTFASGLQQSSHSNFTTVDNPTGGQFVYGSLTGQSSKVGSLVYMLHLTHTHFGDRPQLGKFLQSRDGSTLAVFFTLTAKTMRGQPVAGLVIISAPAQGDPQAAVLYDNANNFASSEPSMMKSLTGAWKGSMGGSSASASATSNAPAADMQPTPRRTSVPKLYAATGGDRSAMVKVPATWQLTYVGGGQLMAEGDRGEMISMGMIYQNIINPQYRPPLNLPRVPMGNGPKVICPINPNLFIDYVCVINQVRRNNGKSQGTFNLTSVQRQPDTAIVAYFTVDFNDGMGPRDASARIGFMVTPNPQSAAYAIGVSMSNIPKKYGSITDPTLKAVTDSYSQDANVVAREGAADISRINAQGEINREAGHQIDINRENNTKAFNSHMTDLKNNDTYIDQHNADIDWQSKINQNYILDRSVIRDVDDTAHATLGNNFAAALVKANPNTLEYVPNQQLVQGFDF